MKRSPKILLFFVVLGSLLSFIYINFCPSMGMNGLDANLLLAEAKQNLRFPELEVVAKVVHTFLSLLLPG